MLLLEKSWTRQPDASLRGVNWRSPLTNGLAFLVNGACPYVDLVNGTLAEPQANFAGLDIVQGGVGPRFSYVNTNGGLLFRFPDWRPVKTAVTFLSATSAPANTTDTGPLIQLKDASTVETIAFLANRSAAGAASSGSLAFYKLNTTANNRGTSFAGAIDGQYHAFAAAPNGGSATSTLLGTDGTVISAAGNDAAMPGFPNGVIVSIGSTIGTANQALNYPHPISAIWFRALSADELASVTRNPWQLFEPRRIWVPVTAGGTNTYTFSVSGGATFSGTSPLVKERVQTPSGGIVFAGAPVISHDRAIATSGQVTFSGSAPIVTTASHQLTPSGGVAFSGTAPAIKEKVVEATGGVNFGGSARLIFVPVGGTGTNDSDRISVGVSRKIGVS